MLSKSIDVEFQLVTKNWDTNLLKDLSEGESTSRNKRGIDFIGDFASFCCNIATQKKLDSLVMQENSLKDQMYKINIGLEKSLKAISETSDNFSKLNKEKIRAFKK